MRIAVVITALIALGSCHGRETITGGYGDRVVVGEVTMAAGMLNGSPEGVRVGVGGTGMSAVLGTDGRFTFIGVPERAELRFTRADVDARLTIAAGTAPLSIELRSNSAQVGRRRASPPVPLLEIEGLIKTVSPKQIVVSDSHGHDVTAVITANTVVRHGHQTVNVADLKPGDRVHVKASVKDGVNTAVEIMVQNPDDTEDDGGMTMTANGTVVEVGSGQLTVASEPHGNVLVKVDGTTTIKKQGLLIGLNDIHAGDEVNCMGTRIDDHTLLARQIEVRGVSGRH